MMGRISWVEKIIGSTMPQSILQMDWKGPEIERYGNDQFGNEWIRVKEEKGFVFYVMLDSEYREEIHFFVNLYTDESYLVGSLDFEAIEHSSPCSGPAGRNEVPIEKREEYQAGRLLKSLFGIK